MNDYYQETKIILDLLYFHYQGSRYQGRGVITWNPEEGFHLEALLDGRIKRIEEINLGKIGIIPKSDFCSIRMRPQGYDWAIAPNIYLDFQSKLNITQSKYLSINFGRLVFCESVSPNSDDTIWTGSALYETKSKFLLPKICYEDEQNRKLIGNFIDDKHLKLKWELPKQFWSKPEAWQWNIAIQDVLSIWFGETVWLLQRSFLRDAQKITEIRQKTNLSKLGLLSPFWGLNFDKQAFIHLTDFFVRDLSKADICRRIFWQLVEASNQQSRQAQELLLSTILEASLRAIDKRPFTVKKEKDWNVGIGLTDFLKAYLPSNDSESIYKRVMKEHCYLRDRNAHPDWLFSQGGSLSEEEKVKSLDSMIFLSRFYGYMILALAGRKNIRPKFPEPHQTWNAAATITTGSKLDTKDIFNDNDFALEATMNIAKKLEGKNYQETTIFWRNFKKRII